VSALPGTLYEPEGDRLVPTGLTRGPWNRDHQHAGPPSALLARAIARETSIENAQLARLSFDILRPIEIVPLTVEARVLRPGRRVEQLEATLLRADDGEVVMRATAWAMRSDRAELPAGAADPDPPPPGPEGGEPGAFTVWSRTEPVAYHAAFDWSWMSGSFEEPGPATVWTRLRVPLVAGEEPAPLERMLTMADAASGVSAALDWERWIFINVDLGIHLERPPRGEWMAMDARTRFGDSGAGLCTSVLSDESGRVGVSTQSLLVAPR
jgi:hypothetical protein